MPEVSQFFLTTGTELPKAHLQTIVNEEAVAAFPLSGLWEPIDASSFTKNSMSQ